MQNSAARMALPDLPYETFVEAVEALARVEKDWVPSKPNTSLYFRPVMMATNADLSLHGCTDCMFYIFCSPVGSYYPGGLKCNSILVEDEDVRAVRGGTGFAKCGGNYACAQRAANRANAKNYNDVLWLDGVERRYVEEVGGMNIMFKVGNTVMTPGSPGQRAARHHPQVHFGAFEGRRLHGGGEKDRHQRCGQAPGGGQGRRGLGLRHRCPVISPVGKLCIHGKDYVIHNNEVGPLSRHLYDTLTGIQWGRVNDTHGWVFPID